MKKTILIALISCISCIAFMQTFAQNVLEIPAGQSVEIDYPDYKSYAATIKTVGMQSIDVAVVNKKSQEQVSGFGLGSLGDEEILVEQENMLVLKNTNDKTVKVNVSIAPKKMKMELASTKNKVSFTLRNSSMKSIPLIIPTVMNPNLSPVSMSGVTLKMGQEVLFKANGKKRVLLVVDNTIKEGDVIDVAKLLPARKKELGLK